MVTSIPELTVVIKTKQLFRYRWEIVTKISPVINTKGKEKIGKIQDELESVLVEKLILYDDKHWDCYELTQKFKKKKIEENQWLYSNNWKLAIGIC